LEEAVEPASIWRRALAYFIDLALVAVIFGQVWIWTGGVSFSRYMIPKTISDVTSEQASLSVEGLKTECGEASPEFFKILIVPSDQKVIGATICVNKYIGRVHSVSADLTIETGDPSGVVQSAVQPLELFTASVWMKLAETLREVAFVFASALLIWWWGQTPGKFLVKIWITNATLPTAFLRELVKHAPNYPMMVHAALNQFGVTHAWGIVGGYPTILVVCFSLQLILVIGLWLYPLRETSTGTLWDRLAKTKVVQQKLQETQPSA
jgi:uncharacterized RDD family membrane protein YckC